MSLCDVRKLKKSYPSFVLSDISFELSVGRIIGFIGRNGAGKTTTIKSILGFVHPDCGEISYFGLPFSENERENKATHWIFYRSSQLLSEERNQEYCCYNENLLQKLG